MGRTYYARHKTAKGNFGHKFDVNISGAHLLGAIAKAVDCHSKTMEAEYAKILGSPNCMPSSTTFKATAKETKEQAKRLRALTIEQWETLYKRNKRLMDMSLPEFREWVLSSWVVFLETSGGYRVP